MRALLLAAGHGTRLRPLTNTMPKCLVPIQGRALLQIWLDRLTQVGIGPFLINTHYLPEQVEAFVSSSRYRDQVQLVHEKELRGTAGTMIANLDFFDGQDGLVVHADNYCLADFEAFLLAHERRPSHCLMTMMTFRSESPGTCGIVELDAGGVVVGFHEKVANPPGNLANGAVYLLSADLLRTMATDWRDAADFSTEILHRLVGRIFTYETKAFFLDIGSPEAYDKANARIAD